MDSKTYATRVCTLRAIDHHLTETPHQPLVISIKNYESFYTRVTQVVNIIVGRYNDIVIMELGDASLQRASLDDIECLREQVNKYNRGEN